MNHDLWTFKYEPKEFEEMILNKTVKDKLRKAFKELPNLMLYGPAGVGKGTFAHILVEKSGYDYMWVNSSDETGIDAMRDKVSSFATSLGMTEMKIVVLNESDSLTQGAQGSQKMLKQLMEDVHKICRFVFLTNDLGLMMNEIQSRCQVIEISNPPMGDIGKHCIKILKSEKVKYDNKVLANIIKKCYPDIRKTIEALKENTFNGVLKTDYISQSEELFSKILEHIIKKDVDTIRNLLRSNYIDYRGLYEYLYENAGAFASPGGAILEIGDHLRWNRSHANKEINFMHMVFRMIWEKII